jgi:TPR repeat protein
MRRRCVIACACLGFSLAAEAQENVFPRMVGEWRELNTATTVIIKPDGSVFSKGGPLRGAVQRSITGGGNFSFENEKAQCSYDIVLLAEDTTASWGLKNETITPGSGAEPGFCLKNGHFMRIETPAELTNRRRTEQDRLDQIEIARRDKERKAEADRIERDRRAEQDRLDRERKAEAERIERERRAEIERLARERAAAEAQERKYKQVAGDCDRLAAAPNDKDKPSDVPGMPWGELKAVAREAIKACGAALAVFIDHPRLVYQLGRAVQQADGNRALKLYTQAADWGHAAAYDNLASMYRDGKYVTKDLDKAMALFRKGALLGDSDAMYSVAYTMLLDVNTQKEGFEWLKKSAALGHEAAKRLLEEYEIRLAAEQKQHQQLRQQYQPTQQYQQPGGIPPEAQIMMQIFGGMLQGMRR